MLLMPFYARNGVADALELIHLSTAVKDLGMAEMSCI